MKLVYITEPFVEGKLAVRRLWRKILLQTVTSVNLDVSAGMILSRSPEKAFSLRFATQSDLIFAPDFRHHIHHYLMAEGRNLTAISYPL